MKTTHVCVFVLLCLVVVNCSDDSPRVETCYEGIVIGQIRSAGGGVAINMQSSALSSHEWRGFFHVVEALNIPRDLWVPGKKIYFAARPGTTEEQGPVTADGDESAKPIIFVISFSTISCPGGISNQ